MHLDSQRGKGALISQPQPRPVELPIFAASIAAVAAAVAAPEAPSAGRVA